MLISVTSLSSYEYCPRKLFMQQVLQLEEPKKDVMLLGLIRHEAHDIINKEEQSIVLGISNKMNFNELLLVYRQKHMNIVTDIIMQNKQSLKRFNLLPSIVFKQTWNKVAYETQQRALILYRFMEKENIFGEELWQKLSPKLSTEVKLSSEKLRLKGIVDKIEIYSPEEYIPYELKTGSLPKEGVWPSHKLQIAAYCMLISERYNKRVRKGYIYYLDANEQRPVVLNPFLEAQINEATASIIDMFRLKEIPKHCANTNKCARCSLKEVCYDNEKLKCAVSKII